MLHTDTHAHAAKLVVRLPVVSATYSATAAAAVVADTAVA